MTNSIFPPTIPGEPAAASAPSPAGGGLAALLAALTKLPAGPAAAPEGVADFSILLAAPAAPAAGKAATPGSPAVAASAGTSATNLTGEATSPSPETPSTPGNLHFRPGLARPPSAPLLRVGAPIDGAAAGPAIDSKNAPMPAPAFGRKVDRSASLAEPDDAAKKTVPPGLSRESLEAVASLLAALCPALAAALPVQPAAVATPANTPALPPAAAGAPARVPVTIKLDGMPAVAISLPTAPTLAQVRTALETALAGDKTVPPGATMPSTAKPSFAQVAEISVGEGDFKFEITLPSAVGPVDLSQARSDERQRVDSVDPGISRPTAFHSAPDASRAAPDVSRLAPDTPRENPLGAQSAQSTQSAESANPAPSIEPVKPAAGTAAPSGRSGIRPMPLRVEPAPAENIAATSAREIVGVALEKNAPEKNFLSHSQQPFKRDAVTAGIGVAQPARTMPAPNPVRRVPMHESEISSVTRADDSPAFPTASLEPAHTPPTLTLSAPTPTAATPPPAANANAAPDPSPAAAGLAHRAVDLVLQVVDAQQTGMAPAGVVKLHFQFGTADLDVRVHLNARGEVHTQFSSDSAELRGALSTEWHAMTAQNAGGLAGLRLADPVFAPAAPSGAAGFGAATGGQQFSSPEQHARQQHHAGSAAPDLRAWRGSDAAAASAAPDHAPARPALSPTSLHLTAIA